LRNRPTAMSKMKKGLTSLALALSLLLVLAPPAFAGLRVAGAKIEAIVAPGSQTAYEINVADTSDTPMEVAIEVKGYGDAPSGVSILDPDEDNSPYSARGFLSVSPDTFHLEPGESRDVTVTAEIPADIGDGGRYAIIYIHTVAPEGSSFATAAAVAARVLLTIEGSELIESGDISQIQLGKSESGQPLGIMAMVKNTGNYHYTLSITGKITDEQGKVVANSSSLASPFPLIPGYSRQIDIPFEGKEALPPGQYQVEIEVKTDDDTIIAQETDTFQLGALWLPPAEEKLPSEGEPPSERNTNWILIGGICGGIVILAMATYIVRLRRSIHR
jgi:P pilus assembly chaperone PapD